mgnify:FL=1
MGPWEWCFSWHWSWLDFMVGWRYQQLSYLPFGVEHWLTVQLFCLALSIDWQQERTPGHDEMSAYLMEYHKEPYVD